MKARIKDSALQKISKDLTVSETAFIRFSGEKDALEDGAQRGRELQ
jgi:predicted PhzF superfamily epimerase YddE/YHI9